MSDETDVFAASSMGSFSLAQGITAALGEAFLRWLTAYLVQTTGVDLAFIGECVEGDTRRLRLHAVAPEDRLGHDLERLPFCDLLADGSCAVPEGVARSLPSNDVATSLGIEAAAGVRLEGANGVPLGVLGVLDRKPRADIEAVLDTLRLFVPRVAGELELLRAARHVRLTTGDATAAPGEDDLERLLAAVGESLGVKVAFLSQLVDPDRLVSRTLVLSIDGVLQDSLEYEMRGTPCEYVLQSPDCFHPHGVRARFPHDPFLARVGAESYYSVAFFGPRGEPVGHLGVMHDGTLPETLRDSSLFKALALRARDAVLLRNAERRRAALDDRLLELQEERLQRHFLPGVVHDLSALVTALLGNTALLLDDASDPKMRRYGERSHAICVRAHELMGHMLAKLGRGRISVSRVDLNDLVTETVELLRPGIEKAVVLERDLDESLPPVAGSRAELGQLVMNLVLNAAQACGKAGRVRISTAVAHLDRATLDDAVVGQTLPEGKFICLRVEDDGRGIPDELRGVIFEPHFTTRKTGHGLGLAAVEQIARRHRAAIHVHSAEGSVFRVSFATG